MDSVRKVAFFLSSLVIAVQLVVVIGLILCGVEQVERLAVASIFVGIAARFMTMESRDVHDEGLERVSTIILALALSFSAAFGHAFSPREYFVAAALAAGAITLADILNPKMKGESKGFFISAPLIMAVPQLSIIVVAAILVTR